MVEKEAREKKIRDLANRDITPEIQKLIEEQRSGVPMEFPDIPGEVLDSIERQIQAGTNAERISVEDALKEMSDKIFGLDMTLAEKEALEESTNTGAASEKRKRL